MGSSTALLSINEEIKQLFPNSNINYNESNICGHPDNRRRYNEQNAAKGSERNEEQSL